jgi:iron complex transport system permease protein
VAAVWRPRALWVSLLLVGAAVVLAILGAGLGDFPMTPREVVTVALGGGDETQRLVLLELRLPRVAAAILVGAALGASGAITQSLARNALASPDVLGVTAGASAAAVAAIVLGSAATAAATPVGLLAPAALAGGLVSACAVVLLAWRGGLDGLRLVLVGIGIGAMLTAVTTWLLVAASITDATRATLWLTGSLATVSWSLVVPLAVTVVLGGLVALMGSFTLSALRFGDDTARALGVRVQAGRVVLVLTAVALASVAVAAAGPIAFVALVAPQVAMRLTHAAGPPVLAGALVGAVLLLASDLVARVVLPVELPVGIVTAVVGAPYLLFLLARRHREVLA